MVEYLRSAAELRPRAVAAAGEPEPGEATVTSSVRRGELFLRDASGAVLRLRWDEGQAGERRVVPAGTYRVLGYRLFEDDWMISATGGKRTVHLRPGATTRVEIAPKVRLKLSAGGRGAARFLNMAVRGDDEMGLSIYREGLRIEVPYTVSRGAKVLQRGTMRYG